MHTSQYIIYLSIPSFHRSPHLVVPFHTHQKAFFHPQSILVILNHV